MKKVRLSICVLIFFFSLISSGNLYADIGLSMQVMGGYIIDNESVESQLRRNSDISLLSTFDAELGAPYDRFAPSKNSKVVDASVTFDYLFFKKFFVRSAIDYAQSAGDFEHYAESSGAVDYYEIRHSYKYIGIPLILGINVPLQNGRHNIYAGAGPSYNMVFLEREGEGNLTAIKFHDSQSFDADGLGFAAVAGINSRFYDNFSVVIELVYHDFSKKKEVEVEVIDEVDVSYYRPQTYLFAAPKTSVRLGVRYSI